MKKLETLPEVIRTLGGVTKAAKVTYRNRQAVTNWVMRGFIPPRAFDLVEQALRRKGCRPERSLFGFDRRPPHKRSDAA